MAYALVASGSGNLGGGGTTTDIDATGASLVVIVLSDASVAATITSDSYSNTWTASTRYGGSFGYGRLFYAVNPSVGAGFNVTVDGDFTTYVIAAFSGAATAAPADVQAGVSSGSSPLSPGRVTPNQNDSLVLSWVCANSFSGAPTVDGSFTRIDYQTAGVSSVLGYLIQTTAQAANPAWTFTGGGSGLGAQNIVFKPAAGGGGGTTARLTLLGVG
jgi:hypothetical protein